VETIGYDPNEPLISPGLLQKSLRNSFSEETDFLKFLKFSNFVPLEIVSPLPCPPSSPSLSLSLSLSLCLLSISSRQALRECDRQTPPLFREKIYILARIGNAKEGLAILLREIGDVKMSIDYIEVCLRDGLPHLCTVSNTISISGRMSSTTPWLITTSW
jgi:hypothetical protein